MYIKCMANAQTASFKVTSKLLMLVSKSQRIFFLFSLT